MMCDVLNRIKRRWMKLRKQPIRVFCFHQTSETYDPDVYCKPDWIPLDFLKNYLGQLQSEGYEFISLQDAYDHICNDCVRTRKYAVLTADDGLKCQLELVPWLEERHIPITLFVNLETLDGKTCGVEIRDYFGIQDKQTEKEYAGKLYFTHNDLSSLSPMVSIGMHGVSHDPVYRMKNEEFRKQVGKCYEGLKKYGIDVMPFFAYPFGHRSWDNDYILRALKYVPVLADGRINHEDPTIIHRELLELIYKS